MKKVIVLLLILLVAGCSDQMRPTVALLTGSNVNLEQESVEYNLQVGLATNEGTEGGLTVVKSDNGWDAVGVYIQQRLLNDPNSLLIGDISLGAKATIDYSEGDNGLYGFYISKITNISGIDIDTQIQYLDFQDVLANLPENQGNGQWRVIVGPKFKF